MEPNMTPESARPFIDVDAPVAAALAAGRPVVALESTIITHGKPYPDNARMAADVEKIVAAEGAAAATIAVIAGRIKIGLSADEREALARTDDALKLSRADLGFAVSQGRTGGTTVAATMILAHMAGMKVFATGGIGGVHKGAEKSFDISADLDELARTPVIVVSAGAKAILDIPKTLEVLETRGVPVIGYGTDEFPAFWTRSSGHPVDQRLDTPDAVAALLDTQFRLGMGGVLIANPIRVEDALEPAMIAATIEQALADADAAGIAGKATTPFLLKRIFELTGGRSLVSNIALVENNARVAAMIAVALSRRMAQ
jgi:pseudouridine-5'-phosphate glycosidase